MEKLCKHCGEPFETNNPQKMYCNRPHYTPCPVCGTLVLKLDNDFSRPNKCCSNKCKHEQRKKNFKPRTCIFCGKVFQPTSGVQTVCDDVHYDNCEICGKSFIRTVANSIDGVTTCSRECSKEKTRRNNLEKYGVEHPMQSPQVQKNFHQAMIKKYGVPHALQIDGFVKRQQESVIKTNMERNGVPYACMLPQCLEAQGRIVSKRNIEFKQKLDAAGILSRFEKHVGGKAYDIFIEAANTLIELDPSYTHSTVVNHWGSSVDKYYHRDKTKLANENGMRCIHVFDWDDDDRIIKLVRPTERRIYARKCQIWKLNISAANEFLREHHIQGTCRGQLVCLGLVIDKELVQVMTFGKPRYDKKFEVELLRLCTKPGYRVVGGASKLFKYFIDFYEVGSVISYCDLSKFTGDVYEQIGMHLLRTTPPQEVWSRGVEKITANLLRQRGYDQLFGTSYGKGTSNELLMIQNGWLPVYDCGQAVFEYRSK